MSAGHQTLSIFSNGKFKQVQVIKLPPNIVFKRTPGQNANFAQQTSTVTESPDQIDKLQRTAGNKSKILHR